MTIGALGFLQPWILTALIALPVIWWLLRFTPPRPVQVAFPPIRLLLGLNSEEETPSKSPWWLTLLRILIAALIILALASPVLNPEKTASAAKDKLLIVVDNGWTSASRWERRQDLAFDDPAKRGPQRSDGQSCGNGRSRARTSDDRAAFPGQGPGKSIRP